MKATKENVDKILADPEWARKVVSAALVADNVLLDGTPDGDDRVRVAHETLDSATHDWSGLKDIDLTPTLDDEPL